MQMLRNETAFLEQLVVLNKNLKRIGDEMELMRKLAQGTDPELATLALNYLRSLNIPQEYGK